jgi:hypothetical protein
MLALELECKHCMLMAKGAVLRINLAAAGLTHGQASF